MSCRKPTLGFPSRTAAIVALSKRGHSVEEIADKVGCTTGSVRSTLSQVNTGRRRIPDSRTVLVPLKVIDQLALPAAARGISANELVRQLLQHIVDDDLVDSVLDDAQEAA